MAIHPMWGTLLFNFESPMVKDFLLANAFYWLEFYHADGLRLDDVDSMLYLDLAENMDSGDQIFMEPMKILQL